MSIARLAFRQTLGARRIVPRVHATLPLRRFVATNGIPTDQPKQQIPRKDSTQEMLQATLPFIQQYGWSMEAMSLGAKSLGYPSVAHGVFSGGEAGLVDAFLTDCRRRFIAMAEERQNTGQFEGYTVSEKVKMLTIMRIGMMKPVIKTWPEALAIMAHPTNVPMSLKHLGEVVDDIWFYAGDRSPDMDWYTKRATLAAIYSSTEVFMTQDVSPNHAETFRFLNRRLDEVAWLDASARQLGTMLAFGAKSMMGMLATRGGRFN